MSNVAGGSARLGAKNNKKMLQKMPAIFTCRQRAAKSLPKKLTPANIHS
jgi:hypothetical protein